MVPGFKNAHIPTHGFNAHTPAHSNPVLLGTHQGTPPQYHPSPVPQNQGWPTTLGQCPMVPIATSPSYAQENKRVRDGSSHAQQQHYYQPPCDDGIASPSSGKKSRQNNYQPPRQVDTQSVVAVTGSLVGGGWNASTTTVQMRRELSSGKLDHFFHNDDMDDSLEHVESRRRSMSF
jgi:hypothetical protein